MDEKKQYITFRNQLSTYCRMKDYVLMRWRFQAWLSFLLGRADQMHAERAFFEREEAAGAMPLAPVAGPLPFAMISDPRSIPLYTGGLMELPYNVRPCEVHILPYMLSHLHLFGIIDTGDEEALARMSDPLFTYDAQPLGIFSPSQFPMGMTSLQHYVEGEENIPLINYESRAYLTGIPIMDQLFFIDNTNCPRANRAVRRFYLRSGPLEWRRLYDCIYRFGQHCCGDRGHLLPEGQRRRRGDGFTSIRWRWEEMNCPKAVIRTARFGFKGKKKVYDCIGCDECLRIIGEEYEYYNGCPAASTFINNDMRCGM